MTYQFYLTARSLTYVLIFILLLSSCSSKMDVKDPHQMKPPYKLIKLFSRKIKPETDLVLASYGYNNNIDKEYQYINGIANFSATYALKKTKNDEISLEFARNLLVFLAENLLRDINSTSEIIPELDVYPFVSDRINITIRFEDENGIGLGQGISRAHFSEGKIKYESYKIHKYTGRYPAEGKHYTIHEES